MLRKSKLDLPNRKLPLLICGSWKAGRSDAEGQRNSSKVRSVQKQVGKIVSIQFLRMFKKSKLYLFFYLGYLIILFVFNSPYFAPHPTSLQELSNLKKLKLNHSIDYRNLPLLGPRQNRRKTLWRPRISWQQQIYFSRKWRRKISRFD